MLVGAGVVLVVSASALVVMVGWSYAVGNFYRSVTADQARSHLDVEQEPVLFHYMSARHFDRAVDLTAGTVAWRRGRPTANFYFLRGIYFYIGHGPTGARSNHARKRRRDGAVVALELQPLLDATAHVRPFPWRDKPLWFRRWDKALAVRADYTGPIIGYRRGIDILTTKTNPLTARPHPGRADRNRRNLEGNTVTSIELLGHRLTQWSTPHDAHVHAAVQLLITHGFWLGRKDFVDAAVRTSGTESSIRWADARARFDAGDFQPASSTELAVLDLAIALGEDRYRLSRMGDANATAIAAAVREAVGG